MKNTKRCTRTHFRRAISLVLCLAALAVFAGCDADLNNTSPTSGIQTPAASPPPQGGGELRLPVSINADVTNPLLVNTEEVAAMFSLAYEQLLSCDQSGRFTPALAENWTSDDSGRVWTFNLRKSVRWQGTDYFLTAQDVKYTLDKLLALGDTSYYSFVFNYVESYEAVDESTLKITMKQPGLASLYALLFPVLCSQTTGSSPGTGPYVFTSVSDEEIVLAANEQWWKHTPYISKVVFEPRENNETALASYLAGQLNFVPTSSLSVGRYREEDNTSMIDMMTQNVELLLVNHHNALLSTPEIRKAIAYGIDRNELITNIYMNRAFAADVPVAPDSFVYESKSKVYDYNPAKATELLTKAGFENTDDDEYLEYPNSANELTFTLLVNETTESGARKDAANMIASQLQKIGIKVEVETAAFSLASESNEYEQRLESGDFDLALVGLNLARNNDVRPLLSGGSKNYGGYAGQSLNDLVKNMVTAADEKSFRDAASQFQLAFVQELPFITLYFRLHSVVYTSELKGVSEIRKPDLLKDIDQWYFYSG
ncbi:MAG: peptide ABC transporter substrate-binding protein [Bacillota bacterium]